MVAKAWLVSSINRTVAVDDGTLALIFVTFSLDGLSTITLPAHIKQAIKDAPDMVIDVDEKLAKAYEFLPYRTLIQTLDLPSIHALSYALQWLNFKTTYLFCHRCGTALEQRDNPTLCPSCHLRHYPPISPCVITAVTRQINNKTHLLLARHHRHKNGMFGLIAGFIEPGESAEMAVVREIKEETALHVDTIRYVASEPYPYPSNLMLGFFANHRSGEICPESCEIAEAGFFNKDNLPTIPQKGTIAHRLIMLALAGG